MRQYIVDTFTNKVFSGNPAAVCFVNEWPQDAVMRAMAAENGLAETAFVQRVPQENGWYTIRWWTPEKEIDLCGHATIAAAAVILNYIEPNERVIHFESKSGVLSVKRNGERYAFVMPAIEMAPVEITPAMREVVAGEVLEAWLGRDLMLVVDSAATVRDAWPTSKLLQTLPGALQTITAPAEAGSGFDCVSRTFAAKLGTYEDAVCGSAHSMIAPYWAGKLGKCDIVAQQASKRGGTLWCEVLNGGRVRIEGNAALYSAADVLAGLEGCPTCK